MRLLTLINSSIRVSRSSSRGQEQWAQLRRAPTDNLEVRLNIKIFRDHRARLYHSAHKQDLLAVSMVVNLSTKSSRDLRALLYHSAHRQDLLAVSMVVNLSTKNSRDPKARQCHLARKLDNQARQE